MSMYNALTAYYDEIFPASEAELAFIKALIKDRDRILDIGCGTGNKTELLATSTNHIYAFDNNAAMIDKAQKSHHKDNIHYLLLPMEEIAARFAGGDLNAAVCLGNTLVHLESKADIAVFIKDIYSILAPEGISVIQILNYQHIIDAHITKLPPLESENAIFERSYAFLPDGLSFNTKLILKKTGEQFENSAILQPVTKSELDEMFKLAGFSDVQYYGSYSGAPLEKDSFVLIAVSKK